MKRSSDRNRNARLRHAQATLLGWTFRPQTIGERVIKNDAGKMAAEKVIRWWADHAGHGTQGPFSQRHHAVVRALSLLGVES